MTTFIASASAVLSSLILRTIRSHNLLGWYHVRDPCPSDRSSQVENQLEAHRPGYRPRRWGGGCRLQEEDAWGGAWQGSVGVRISPDTN
jgi:hypothetical protein